MVSNSPELWPSTEPTSEVSTDGPNADAIVTSDVNSDAAASQSPAPETSPETPPSSITQGESKSKSRRIREYLEDHPEARNRDIASALEQFGVRPADVANVKAQQKNKGASKPTVELATAAPTQARGKKAAKKSPRKTAGPKASTGRQASIAMAPPASTPNTADINLNEVDAAIRYIEQAGGIERAKQIIELVERIRGMNIG